MKVISLFFIFSVALLIFTSCEVNNNIRLKIFVSIPPQKYFAERIGGEYIDVSVMVRPGMNPANYEPLPKQMLELSNTSIFFTIGVPFERIWLDKIKSNYPKLKFVNIQKRISLHKMDSFIHVVKQKDNRESDSGNTIMDEHQEYTGFDPHTWLSPALVKIQAKNIYDALSRINSSRTEHYQNNYNKFIEDLDALSKEIENIFSTTVNKKFLVFHPSWSYFAKQYGLKQIPIEIEGKEPNPKELAAIIEYAKKENIKTIFVQTQFSTKGAEAIANEIGARVITIDPLSDDYINNLRNAAKTIANNN